MEIHVLTESATVRKCFSTVERSRIFTVAFHPVSKLQAALRGTGKPAIVYLDITSLTTAQRERTIREQPRESGVGLGILDPRGVLDDVASCFHRGVVDYLGKALLKEGLTVARIQSAFSYFGDAKAEAPVEPKRGDGSPNATSWKLVKPGKRYTFCMMLFELDLDDDWRRKSGIDHLDRVTAALEEHIHRFVEPLGGRLWIWGEFGGLILFPFEGKSCEAALACARLMVNRVIVSAEDYDFHTLLSYRIALHVGATAYQPRGKTGTIISDAVNYLFHLGHDHAQPGNFYVSGSFHPYLPKGLETLFLPNGEFEGKAVFRMRRQLH